MQTLLNVTKNLQLKYLVLDYDGTLARDGRLRDGIKDALKALAEKLQIHVLTPDTFGKALSQVEGIPCKLSILSTGNEDTAKLDYVKRLGSEFTVCIGNGRNDRLMVKEAALGVAVLQEEGAAVDTLVAADIVCTDILSALKTLTNPLRLAADLWS